MLERIVINLLTAVSLAACQVKPIQPSTTIEVLTCYDGFSAEIEPDGDCNDPGDQPLNGIPPEVTTISGEKIVNGITENNGRVKVTTLNQAELFLNFPKKITVKNPNGISVIACTPNTLSVIISGESVKTINVDIPYSPENCNPQNSDENNAFLPATGTLFYSN